MIPAAFDYIAPQSLDEALRVLAAHGEEAKLLAGGHSLLPLLKLRLANPKLLIDLSKVPGLSGISQQDDKIVLGALATHYQIESSKLLKSKCPLLPETARFIGDVQVRNRGTIGGSLVHADPSAELPLLAVALDSTFHLRSAPTSRSVAAKDFYQGYL
ncbi:MAG: FAD binding domain-containing protein, partial [Candidatus Binatia bacterium]